jgi:hypothetical protein
MGVLQICARGSSQPRWCVGSRFFARFIGVQICQVTRQLERAVKLELRLMFVLERRTPSKVKLSGLHTEYKKAYRIAGLKGFGLLVTGLLEHFVHHHFRVATNLEMPTRIRNWASRELRFLTGRSEGCNSNSVGVTQSFWVSDGD